MSLLHVIILSFVQGLTELLPVSSSAHVIVVAKLLHENMSSPANSLLLVMLHTGTMFAVIVYFWRRWFGTFFASREAFYRFLRLIFGASLASGVVAVPVILAVDHILSRGAHPAVIEDLFNKLNWIGPALAAVGILIVFAGRQELRKPATARTQDSPLTWRQAITMGIVQGLAIPFRGFSRSGSTISSGLLTGGERREIESFSFAMVVAITPLAIGREVYRLVRNTHRSGAAIHLASALTPSLVGAVCAFLAGLLALRWLSQWLEHGRWHLFGIYCLVAATVMELLYLHGW
jgi:undecaprenyl-diphosphatase